MPRTTPRQRKTTGRVMHEFATGELKSGRGGKGGKVRSRRQAIAIALSEAGASRSASSRKNARSFAQTRRKEALGKTAQQEREGKARVGARSRRESSPAMGGRNATRTTKRGAKAARTRSRREAGMTKMDLYRQAQRKHIAGRSRMTKRQLENALRRA